MPHSCEAYNLADMERARLQILWEQVKLWIDWHGRITTVLAIVVSLGGATIVNRASAIWGNVTGTYLWIVTALSFVVFGCCLIIAGRKLRPLTPRQASVPPYLMLTPSSGPSDKMLLAVMNRGNKQKFHAQCRLLGRRNDPNALRRTTYDLQWENEESREVLISTRESRNLLIATAEIDRAHDSEEVRLMERAGVANKCAEWSRWPHNAPKPEYDLEISIFSEGDGEPYVERFTLKCGGRESALELVRSQLQTEIGKTAGTKTEFEMKIAKVLFTPSRGEKDTGSPIFHMRYDVFVLAELKLKEPQSAVVSEYEIKISEPHGNQISCSSMDDLDDWVWIDENYEKAVSLPPLKKDFPVRGETASGWLHFESEEMGIGARHQYTFTLKAKSTSAINEVVLPKNFPSPKEGHIRRKRGLTLQPPL